MPLRTPEGLDHAAVQLEQRLSGWMKVFSVKSCAFAVKIQVWVLYQHCHQGFLLYTCNFPFNPVASQWSLWIALQMVGRIGSKWFGGSKKHLVI